MIQDTGAYRYREYKFKKNFPTPALFRARLPQHVRGKSSFRQAEKFSGGGLLFGNSLVNLRDLSENDYWDGDESENGMVLQFLRQ